MKEIEGNLRHHLFGKAKRCWLSRKGGERSGGGVYDVERGKIVNGDRIRGRDV